MRYFLCLCLLTSLSAHAEVFFQCNLNDGTTIVLEKTKGKWSYQSQWTKDQQVLWKVSPSSKVPFYSARQLMIENAQTRYVDNATIRFKYENIHYILFNEFKQQGKDIEEKSGVLVVQGNEQAKFTCDEVSVNRLYEALPAFTCDAKMRNKQGVVCQDIKK